MKRYRVLEIDFDTRARVLKLKIQKSWEPKVKESWKENKKRIKEGLSAEFGIINGNRKIENFKEIESPPFSITAFHNKFLKQIRYAYVIESYYPALVGACALGERILNHLILNLKDHFKSSSEYKKVYRKQSFDNWDTAIDTLESWNVLLNNCADDFRDLKDLRNSAIHFNPETDNNAKKEALDAIKKLQEIINGQFSTSTNLPWIISSSSVPFVKKGSEENPFVKEIVLPNCKYVGYKHKLSHQNGKWSVHDDHKYEDKEITDEKFVELYKDHKGS